MGNSLTGPRVHAAGLLAAGSDALVATELAFWKSRESILKSWLLVPLGLLAILATCFGVDSLFKHLHVSFPASVACMLLLFAALWICDGVIGTAKTRRIVAVIDVPAGWSLRWLSIQFTPTFITLPLSPPITAGEVGKMIAVFVIGFAVMFVLTAYMTRGLQRLTGSHKKAQAARAEELGPHDDDDEIPMANTTSPPAAAALSGTPAESTTGAVSAQASSVALHEPLLQPPDHTREPSHVQPVTDHGHGRNDHHHHHFESREMTTLPSPPPSLPLQVPPPPPRARLWATLVQAHLDEAIYLALFLFVGLPVYYATGYAMPLHLTFTVLMYFAALSLPLTWKQVLHPVLVSALATVLGLWVLGLARHQALGATLRAYSTGTKYLQLWGGGQEQHLPLPGAGDVLGTILDASIVALALPMYQYRRELVAHWPAVVAPNLVLSVGSLYAYPRVCCALGIGAARSLAFAARSLTLALAIPATENLGGDRNTVAAVAIMSGIVGALVGVQILDWLKIPEDDYVTRGVTLGANSSAVATALLLRSDPRAAALSSLSMSLFGTMTVLLTSVPPVAHAVQALVGT